MKRPPFDPTQVKPDDQERSETARGAVLSVSQLTRLVKRAIEKNLPRTVRVVGEISNFKRHTSGHLYFVLKDGHCELSCVMWRSAAASLEFDVADGLEVLVTGQVDVFERSGRYQLYVRRIEPKGVGALELAFRQLREKLEKEGLFDLERKKPLPRFPERIAVVTSPTGAAIRDILQTLERRYPAAGVLIHPVAVQGEKAAGEIAAAIQRLNAQRDALGGIDCIIVGRGGGSLEDLWAFNEEIVARAIFASAIPVVSAVGHEVDFSISDMVADVRAATPTAAAELVTPDRDELLADIDDTVRHLTRLVAHRVALQRSILEGILQRKPIREPLWLVQHRQQTIDDLQTRLQRSTAERLHLLYRALGAIEVTLQTIRPDLFLARFARKLSDAGHRIRWSLSRRLVLAERMLAGEAERFAAVHPARRADRMKDHVDALRVRLDAMSHKSTLRRGFTITRSKKRRSIVRDPKQLADGDTVVTQTAAGDFQSRVINLKQQELFD